MNRIRSISIFFAITSAIAALASCGAYQLSKPEAEPTFPDTETKITEAKPSEQLPFGNPSNAVADPNIKDNYLLIKSASAISYNNTRGTANWIQWKTSKESLGNSIPRPDFEPDTDLPKSFRRITTRDYIGTGYQRGHLVPSADRFGDRSLNAETFLMTNIVPQLGALNEYPWEKLESYVRSQVRRGRFDAYQIAGVYGEKEILKRKVTVPTNCWKIIAFVRRGDPPETINEQTRMIVVDMPNTEGIDDKPWETFRTTIRSIEERTGLDLFAWLPREEQDRIEMQIEISSKMSSKL